LRLQTPNPPACTLQKIAPETPSKKFQTHFIDLHDFSKYVSKLKTNLCNHLIRLLTKSKNKCILANFLSAKFDTERKMPQHKGDPKKNKATSINKPYVIKHQGNMGPLCLSTW